MREKSTTKERGSRKKVNAPTNKRKPIAPGADTRNKPTRAPELITVTAAAELFCKNYQNIIRDIRDGLLTRDKATQFIVKDELFSIRKKQWELKERQDKIRAERIKEERNGQTTAAINEKIRAYEQKGGKA
jgi:hypothetical protein